MSIDENVSDSNKNLIGEIVLGGHTINPAEMLGYTKKSRKEITTKEDNSTKINSDYKDDKYYFERP